VKSEGTHWDIFPRLLFLPLRILNAWESLHKESYSLFYCLFKEYCTCKIGQSSNNRTEDGKYLYLHLKHTYAEALLQNVVKYGSIFLIIKPTRCTNFSNLFLEWNSTCFGQFLCQSSGVFHRMHSNGICHTVLLTACKQDQDDPASKLSANLYDIYHCCVYSEKLLMTDRGTVRNT